MPTKKELFLSLKSLLSTNIPEVNNKVYSAFPKKKYTLPLVVISNVSESFNDKSFSGYFHRTYFAVDIIIFTKTAQELDELSDKIMDTLRNNAQFNKYPDTLGEIDSFEYTDDNNKIIHQRTVALTYTY